jgi:DNA primase
VYDSDDAGRIASQKIKEKYSDMFEISTIVLPDGKDPSDLTVEELQIETRKML